MDEDLSNPIIAFLKEREAEQRAELNDILKALGRSLGVELTVEDFTPAMADRFAQKVEVLLRASGKSELAYRCRSRYTRRSDAIKHLEDLLAKGGDDLAAATTACDDAMSAAHAAQE